MEAKEWFDGLSEELQAKVKACKSMDELKGVLKGNLARSFLRTF